MAAWDSPDLLARCKRLAKRPTTDAQVADADWYAWLTEGEAFVVQQIATHVPDVLYNAPTKLSTSDSGVTYDFPSSIYPLGNVELRKSPTGRVMIPGAQWDSAADYVPAGNKIRFPDGKAKTFTDGPYARWVAEPGAIDASTASIVKPDHVRVLVVYKAVETWARHGGNRDPGPFEELYFKAWAGDPRDVSDIGILGALKNQFLFSGAASQPVEAPWYFGIDDGSGYNAQL